MLGVDRKIQIDRPEPAGGEADGAPARTFLDYIDELGGPVVILLLIFSVAFLLL